MDIIGLSVGVGEGGARIVTVSAELARGEEMDQNDLQQLIDTLEEANGNEVSRDTTDAEPEAKPAKPRQRKKAAAEEPEPEDDAPKKRTRKKAADTAEEPEADAPKKRTRKKKEPEPEPEPEFDGPSQDDVNLAAANLAEALGSEVAGEIIIDGFSPETGMVSDIAPEKRQAFIDEVEFQLAD